MVPALILDLILLAIIVFYIVTSARHGFVRTLIEVAGFIAAFFIAFTVSSPLADVTYDKIIEPQMIAKVESASSETTESITGKFWDAIPDIFKGETFGISKDSIDKSVSGNITESATAISRKVTKPVVTKMLGLLYSTVLVVVFCIISKFLAKIVNKAFSFSFIGKINRALGGIVGIVKGIGAALIFCMLVSVLILVTKDGVSIFTPDNIKATYLFKIFYGISPFV